MTSRWVVDDVASVRAEVAPWRDLAPAELWRVVQLCAHDAMWAAKVSGMRERILTHVDPLPPSSVAALARLRREAGWGDARR